MRAYRLVSNVALLGLGFGFAGAATAGGALAVLCLALAVLCVRVCVELEYADALVREGLARATRGRRQ